VWDITTALEVARNHVLSRFDAEAKSIEKISLAIGI
jgi:hypothetical protein